MKRCNEKKYYDYEIHQHQHTPMGVSTLPRSSWHPLPKVWRHECFIQCALMIRHWKKSYKTGRIRFTALNSNMDTPKQPIVINHPYLKGPSTFLLLVTETVTFNICSIPSALGRYTNTSLNGERMLDEEICSTAMVTLDGRKSQT